MFQIRRMGCNGTHGADFKINRPNGYNCYLLLIIKTPAKFFIHGEEYQTAANSLIIYPPYTPHNYCAVKDIYINDWMQFDADETFFKAQEIPLNRIITLGLYLNLYTIFQLIAELFYSELKSQELVNYHLTHALFYSISHLEHVSLGFHRKELVELRLDIYSNPSLTWNLSKLAARLNISLGHLQLLYKNTFGITCQKDIEKSRMECACRLLSSTNLTIKQTSFECGYQNSEHFMRSFKKYFGCTPSEYRNQTFAPNSDNNLS
ncbi:MAG: AraC family transcriptional regulator [Mobilitalea sp.]